jgi:hypothetical protein
MKREAGNSIEPVWNRRDCISGAVKKLTKSICRGHRRHAACLALDASTNHGFPIISMVDPAACDTLDLVRKMVLKERIQGNLVNR